MSLYESGRSELERDPDKLHAYVRMLESALGDPIEVTAVLEIGSFAKGEAVPTSDVDTRAYVCSPTAYVTNVIGEMEREPPLYKRLVREHGPLPRREYGWAEFNGPLSAHLSACLGCSVELGLADRRYAAYVLDHLDKYPSLEHSLLFQSNILYDPRGFLREKRRALEGRIYPGLVRFYWGHLRDRVSRRLYSFLQPHPWDAHKLATSGQIQWVQQAVRCLRDAVAYKTYGATGEFTYRMQHVLRFYQQHLPHDLPFVRQVYGWKTDPVVRMEMVDVFTRDPHEVLARFRASMPQLEAVVRKVRALPTVQGEGNG